MAIVQQVVSIVHGLKPYFIASITLTKGCTNLNRRIYNRLDREARKKLFVTLGNNVEQVVNASIKYDLCPEEKDAILEEAVRLSLRYIRQNSLGGLDIRHHNFANVSMDKVNSNRSSSERTELFLIDFTMTRPLTLCFHE